MLQNKFGSGGFLYAASLITHKFCGQVPAILAPEDSDDRVPVHARNIDDHNHCIDESETVLLMMLVLHDARVCKLRFHETRDGLSEKLDSGNLRNVQL